MPPPMPTPTQVPVQSSSRKNGLSPKLFLILKGLTSEQKKSPFAKQKNVERKNVIVLVSHRYFRFVGFSKKCASEMLTGDASAYMRQRQRQQPCVIIAKKQVCAFVRQVTRQHRQQHRPLSHPHSVLPPPSPLPSPLRVVGRADGVASHVVAVRSDHCWRQLRISQRPT